MDNTFMTPEGHEKFTAKKLFNEMGKIQWGSCIYRRKWRRTKTDEMFFVNGMTPHSIWNNEEKTAKGIKISVAP